MLISTKRFMAAMSIAFMIAAPLNAWANGSESVFAAGEHCVAYRTQKGMLLMFEATVLGRSCRFDVTFDESDEGYRLMLSIPLTSFDSGNGTRDRHVAELLGGPNGRAVEFVSQWLTRRMLQELWDGQPRPVAGELFLQGAPRAVAFDVNVSVLEGRRVLSAQLQTRFSTLGVVVPRVGPGGLIAAPGDNLELLAQLDLGRAASPALLEGLAKRQTPGNAPQAVYR